jgi:hypothetical protein
VKTLSNEIVRADVNLLIDPHLPVVDHFQDRHRDRQFVNRLHGVVDRPVEISRFAGLNQNSADTDLTFRRGRDLGQFAL